MMRRIALFALMVLLAGCSIFGSGKSVSEPTRLAEFKESARILVRWHRDVGDAHMDALQPAVVGDAVYAANAAGEIYRFQAATGKEDWRVDSGLNISAGVGAGEGLVLVGGNKGGIAAFGEDGKLRWKAVVSSEVLSAPQVADGIVAVRTGDGRITGLKAADGSRLWIYEHTTPALTIRNHAGVLIRDGAVYAGFAAGKLAAVDLTSGILKWESAVSLPAGNTELERISDITSLPVAGRNQICAVAFQGNVACFDMGQGVLQWSRALSSENGMALGDKYLYVTDAEDIVSALDKTSGSALWKNDKLSRRRVSKPRLLDKFVVVGDFEGYLHVLNRDDGGFAARLKTGGGPIVTAPEELDGGLVVQTSGGGLYSVAIH